MLEIALAGERRIDDILEKALGNATIRAQLYRRIGWPEEADSSAAVLVRNETSGHGMHKGEDDVRLLLDGAPRVLFENKFNSDFQPRQGARYKERARWAQERSGGRPVITILTAPEGYLTRKRFHPEARAFDFRFSLRGDWMDLVARAESLDPAIAAVRDVLAEIEHDFAICAFQGVKGKFPEVHDAIWQALAGSQGWYQVNGNEGDYVHVHHESTSAYWFQYRIKPGEVAVEVKHSGFRFTQAAIADAQARGWRLSQARRNIVVTLGMHFTSEDRTTITPQRAQTAASAMDALVAWINSGEWLESAASTGPSQG